MSKSYHCSASYSKFLFLFSLNFIHSHIIWIGWWTDLSTVSTLSASMENITKLWLHQENMADIQEVLAELKEYLLSLDDHNGNPLYCSQRKTFIVGFSWTSEAVVRLARDLFSENFTYFPTFWVSQDHIETLFSKIRRMGGHNNNPTSVAFTSALRNLLAKQPIVASKSANSLDCDSTTGVFTLEWSKRVSAFEQIDMLDVDDLSHKLRSIMSSSELKSNILYYIAGYIVRSLRGKLKCENCAQQLVKPVGIFNSDHSYYSTCVGNGALLNVKDWGGLVRPSDQVFHVVERCEAVLLCYLSKNFLSRRYSKSLLLALFTRSHVEDRPTKFFRHSCDLVEGQLDHTQQLTREISSRYIEIRLKHFSKQYNHLVVEKGKGSERFIHNRLVIFKHQWTFLCTWTSIMITSANFSVLVFLLFALYLLSFLLIYPIQCEYFITIILVLCIFFWIGHALRSLTH